MEQKDTKHKKMNIYLKSFLFIALPVTILFSIAGLLVNDSEDFILVTLFGLILGSVLSLIAGFVLSPSLKDTFEDYIKDAKARFSTLSKKELIKRYLLILIYSISGIMFGSLASHFKRVLIFYLLNLGTNIILFVFYLNWGGELKKLKEEKQFIYFFGYLIKLIVSVTVTFFIFYGLSEFESPSSP